MSAASLQPYLPAPVPAFDTQSNDSESDGPATPVDAAFGPGAPWLSVPLHFSYDQPYPSGYDAPKAFGYETYPSSQDSSASASSLDSLLVHASDTVEPCATYLSYPDPEPAIHAPVPQPSHTPILYWTGADVEASLAAYQPPPVEEVVAPQAAPSLPAAQPVSLPGYWQFVPQVSNSTSSSSSEQQPPPTAHASYSWPAQHAAPPSLPPLVVNPAPVTRIHQPSTRHVPTSPSIRLPALWPKVPSVAPRQSPDQHAAPPAAQQQPWVPPTPVASTPSRLPQSQPKRKRKRDDDEDSSDDGFSLAVHLWPSEKRARYFAASETRRRALAERVGFLPTDPETLSSHDKKRAYVECMEQYIEFLHQQLRLVGHEPVAMEKVESYSGLNTRSIRTMAVYMQTSVRRAHVRVLNEERAFLEMCNRLAAQGHGDYHEGRML